MAKWKRQVLPECERSKLCAKYASALISSSSGITVSGGLGVHAKLYVGVYGGLAVWEGYWGLGGEQVEVKSEIEEAGVATAVEDAEDEAAGAGPSSDIPVPYSPVAVTQQAPATTPAVLARKPWPADTRSAYDWVFRAHCFVCGLASQYFIFIFISLKK